MDDKSLVVFQDKKIRRTWFNDEWWFVAVDIVEALTDSKDPKGYLKDMRRRDEGFSKGWVQIATPLQVSTPGGKHITFWIQKRPNKILWAFILKMFVSM
ncbi:hypothetical protein GOV08_03650, partial [Candidatus Woesearchaeota archaeon]|nr:hypothetical protein [Candidatus Woesearchaeota archaeon]